MPRCNMAVMRMPQTVPFARCRPPWPRPPGRGSHDAMKPSSPPPINRELSQLAFNRRVLTLAQDASTPLLEQLRFLCIVSNNLDEFFEIRVAGLKEQLRARLPPPGMTLPGLRALLGVISDETRSARGGAVSAAERSDPARVGGGRDSPAAARCPRCRAARVGLGLFPARGEAAADAHRARSRASVPAGRQQEPQFRRRARPAATRSDARPRSPRSRRRASCRGSSRFPRAIAGSDNAFVLLSSVIHAHLQELFGGRDIVGYSQFRVTRDADLWFDEEEVKNLRQALEGELPQRHFGQAVRLEVAAGCPDKLAQFLLRQFELTDDDLYRVDGPVNLARMAALIDAVSVTGLEYRPFVPGLPDRLRDCGRSARHDPAAGRAAAPSVPVVRSGRRVHPQGRRRPGCRRDQADGLSHRRQFGADGGADRGRAPRQGSHRRRRAPRPLRRGSEHQLGREAGAGGGAGRLRRVRPEDAREARAAAAPRARCEGPHAAAVLRASRNRQLSSAHRAPLHRFRASHRQPGDLRGRQRGVPAHHEPRQGEAAEAPAARAVHDARPRAVRDPARSAPRARGQAGADHREDERAASRRP